MIKKTTFILFTLCLIFFLSSCSCCKKKDKDTTPPPIDRVVEPVVYTPPPTFVDAQTQIEPISQPTPQKTATTPQKAAIEAQTQTEPLAPIPLPPPQNLTEETGTQTNILPHMAKSMETQTTPQEAAPEPLSPLEYGDYIHLSTESQTQTEPPPLLEQNPTCEMEIQTEPILVPTPPLPLPNPTQEMATQATVLAVDAETETEFLPPPSVVGGGVSRMDSLLNQLHNNIVDIFNDITTKPEDEE
jgi:hypothetical protein